MKNLKNLDGKLNISRPHGSDEVIIELTDEKSGVEAVEIHMTAAQFTDALFARAMRPCTFTIRPKLVGKRFEHKTELVPCDGVGYGDDSKAEAAARLAPFEVDGWIGDATDMVNHHRRRDGFASVTFRRWVDDEGKVDADGE